MGSNQSKEAERNVHSNRNNPKFSIGVIPKRRNEIHGIVEASKELGCQDKTVDAAMAKSGLSIRQPSSVVARSTKSAGSRTKCILNNSHKIQTNKKQKKQNDNVNTTVSSSLDVINLMNVNTQDIAPSLPCLARAWSQEDNSLLHDSLKSSKHERKKESDHRHDAIGQESCELERVETGIVRTESCGNTSQGLRGANLSENIRKSATVLPVPNLFAQSSFPSNRVTSYSASTESSSLNRTYKRSSNELHSQETLQYSNPDSTVLNDFTPNATMPMSGLYRPGSSSVDVFITQETLHSSADISYTGNIRETDPFRQTSIQSVVSSNIPVTQLQTSPSSNSRLNNHHLSFTNSNSSPFGKNSLAISQRCNIEANTHTFPNWNELAVDIEVDSPEETIEHHQLTKERMIAQQVREYFSYTNNSKNASVSAHKTDHSNLAGGYITIRNADGDISTQISAKHIKLTPALDPDELTDENMGIILERPKHPRYATLASRIQSFKNWPRTSSMSFEALAEAGFVYTGTADCVRCFYCNGGLREWLEEDCPWTEHARYYPHCPHVRQCKGAEFVRTLHKRTGNISHNHNDSVNTSNGDGEDDENEGDDESGDDDDDDKQLEYQEVMRAANEFVTDKALVDKAARYLKFIGKDYFDVQQLVDIVYDIEEGKIDIDDIEEEIDEIVDDTDEGPDTKMMEPQDINTQRLAEENRLLKERALCKVCLDATASVLFLDCGHMVACPMCAPALKTCAVCRQEIKGTIRTRFA